MTTRAKVDLPAKAAAQLPADGSERQVIATAHQRKSKALLYLCAGLAALAGISYMRMLSAGFLNFDDNTWVAANPHVNSGLSFHNIKWAFRTVYASNYVPLTWISHMLDCQLFGLVPGAHHAINILFHATNTVLFFLLLQRAVASPWPAAVGAALLGLHPIHVESVAWIAERKDVLSAFFFLLTCHAYFSYAAKPILRRYLAVLVLLLAGLLAKPMLVALPFILSLLDIWPLHRIPMRRSGMNSSAEATMGDTAAPRWRIPLIEKLPLMLLALGACLITFFAQRSSGTMSALGAYPLDLRIGNALDSYVAYLQKLCWPAALPVVEPLTRHPLTSVPVIAALALLVTITGLTLSQIRRRPWLAVGWLWYVGALVPVIGLVQVGGQGMAYRYTYIPFMGLSLALSGSLQELLRSWRTLERTLAFAGSGLALGLSVLTWNQTRFWHDNETLYHYSLRHSQRNWMVLNNLGVYLAGNQRYSEAIPCLEQALTFAPGHFQAANTLGFALEHAGRQPEAVGAFQKAISIRPQECSSYESLITVLIEMRRFDDAMQVCDRLLALDGNRCASVVAQGSVLLAAERRAEALKAFEHALGLSPSDDVAKYYLAMASQQTGQPERAAELLQQPLQLNEVQRLNRFITSGAALRDLHQYQKSADVFRQGLSEFPRRLELVEPLAYLEYTFLKDYPNALPHFRLMLELTPNHPERATYLAAIKYMTNQHSLRTNALPAH